MMYETILSPIHYGGMQLKNRIIFAPTTFGLSDEEYLAKIRAIAQGGCAMIIVGDVPVGKSKFEKSLFDAKGFAFYQQVVKIAHDADCKVCAQLTQRGENAFVVCHQVFIGWDAQSLGGLTAQERQQLLTLLQKAVQKKVCK